MSDDTKVSSSRFTRLAKLASLSARLSGEAVRSGVRRFTSVPDGPVFGAGAAEKLVATLGDLKGLAMKVGQSISMDPDLLSPEIRSVVARLQNQAPPMGWEQVREVVAAELGRPPEHAYAEFERSPVASASLGQVHRAITLDGERVAVKVQYPDIGKALVADLANLGALVSVVAAGMRVAQSRSYFTEVQRHLLDELDYRQEAERSVRFAEATAPFSDLRVPRVFPALTSERVLTLEWMEGRSLRDFLAAGRAESNAERFRVSRLLIRSICGPFLGSGLIHADPHPGNFILQADGRMAVLDFGSVKELSPMWVDVNRRTLGAALRGEPLDAVALSVAGGFDFDDAAAARPFVEGVFDIALRAHRSAGPFDYATAGINRDMRQHFLRNATRVVGDRPPAEAVLYFRAVGGMNQNLENLGAVGDFGGVYAELLDLAPS